MRVTEAIDVHVRKRRRTVVSRSVQVLVSAALIGAIACCRGPAGTDRSSKSIFGGPGDERVMLGHVGAVRLRIPAGLVLSAVTSRSAPDWEVHPPEPNDFSRPIRFFDLKLEGALPNSPTLPADRRSFNERGFVEADAFVATPAQTAEGPRRFVAAELAGTGLSGAFRETGPLAGMRHWRATRPPPEAAVHTDIYLDEAAGFAAACTGGDLHRVRGRGICTVSFHMPRPALVINASFSAADVAETRVIKRGLEGLIASFVVHDGR